MWLLAKLLEFTSIRGAVYFEHAVLLTPLAFLVNDKMANGFHIFHHGHFFQDAIGCMLNEGVTLRLNLMLS